ncbi:GGDEF domain-containing protein [Salinivibrio sp. ES.052]|uniref:GGDEF domain-containing protein n=1 Tax=Salinivibrio sp. ES.052 TaxID=1882823 RepID=UPI0009266F73|nr:GGDEF domain-containing protein [Salinivibrio sp. ES.052]SIO34375.1 diguanylate cyclase [Salinivibrio sp. ES.052]
MTKRDINLHGLQTRVACIVLAISLLFAVGTTLTQMYINYQRALTTTTQLVENRSQNATRVISHALWVVDLELVRQSVKGLSMIPTVCRVAVKGFDGTHITEVNHNGEGCDGNQQSLLTVQDNNIGTLNIVIDRSEVKREALSSALPVATVHFVETLTITLLILWILNRLCSRPLKQLSSALDYYQADKANQTSVPIQLIQRNDEIGNVSRSINAMQSRIRDDLLQKRSTERELRQHQTLLEEQVEQRTKALNWQSNASSLLADISIQFLRADSQHITEDVELIFPKMASLLGVEAIGWYAFDAYRAKRRCYWPTDVEFAPETVDLSDMHMIKRWLADIDTLVVPHVGQLGDDAINERSWLRQRHILSFAAFPLTDGRKSFGMITVANRQLPFIWDNSKTLLLKRFATAISEVMIRERNHFAMEELQEELIIANEKLKVQAETDDLTRLSTRRPFKRELKNHIYDGIESGLPVAVMMIDIDHFKAYNDEYGHLQGDEVLTKIARVLLTQTEAYQGSVARFGGEEFAITLPTQYASQLNTLADGIRDDIAELALTHVKNPDGDVITVSIGGIVTYPSNETSDSYLLEMADQRLYQAKEEGRDRINILDQREEK